MNTAISRVRTAPTRISAPPAAPPAASPAPADQATLNGAFHALPDLPRFDALSVRPEAVKTAAGREQVADQMRAHLKAFPSLSATIAVVPDGSGNTSVIVGSRDNAAAGSRLEGVYAVLQRLCSSTAVKAAAQAHPVSYLAAQAFDAAGDVRTVRLPGTESEAQVAAELRAGGQPNQYDQLKALVGSLPQGRRVALLIGGGSAAGKSSLIRQIKQFAGDRKVVDFTGDMYFRDADDAKLPHTADGGVYWDNPQAMHFQQMAGDIVRLVQDGHADIPVYDFGAKRPGGWREPNVTTSGMRLAQTTPTRMGPDDILVIDSIHATNSQVIDKLSQLGLAHASVYLDSEGADDRLTRRIVRDFDERGRTPQETLRDWDHTTFPGEVSFVRPTITNLDPAEDLFLVNHFPKDPGLSREEIDHRVEEQAKYGLTPTYEAFATPDDRLADFARAEKKRFEDVLAAPSASDADRAKARAGLERLEKASERA